ncbi:hypothetical protein [Alkalicoccobacillus porphyridii]|uniref:Uncharacterized protein n=1 Tax=Alkalicoccobacillus porphyridii TaxID=2597270 RepID=A0A554A2C5_9BACI|nr:hypothetical protein [Alkalicoccobacillus porphyridii]TSB47842.1 hypothetical protein FN960_04860 [Alkalicoccobacillus porphyridii]
MKADPNLSHADFLAVLESVRYSAKEETKFEVAECMLDYGIDIKLVGAVTGLSKSQLTKETK